MTNPTRPEGIVFQPVSEALIRVRLIGLAITLVVIVIAGGIVGYLTHWGVWVGAGVLALLHLWLMWLVPRQVRAIGYYEGADDFLIASGIMFRELNVIPYGRIQFVDVNEGPIARKYGITSITLHTASAETAGKLEGLPAAEAARLRDMLASRGSAEQAGL